MTGRIKVQPTPVLTFPPGSSFFWERGKFPSLFFDNNYINILEEFFEHRVKTQESGALHETDHHDPARFFALFAADAVCQAVLCCWCKGHEPEATCSIGDFWWYHADPSEWHEGKGRFCGGRQKKRSLRLRVVFKSPGCFTVVQPDVCYAQERCRR